ncbi:MAG: DUF3303 family protein [Deltaproteobacteria bacterium]|nr:DUF3303 family protein [Deltaproteobacteria bacterium]
MLFMGINEYDSENKDATIKRFVEKGLMLPEGVKEIGLWSQITGGRIFGIFETDDPAALVKFAHEWNDLGVMEMIPIMDSREVIKIVAGG